MINTWLQKDALRRLFQAGTEGLAKVVAVSTRRSISLAPLRYGQYLGIHVERSCLLVTGFLSSIGSSGLGMIGGERLSKGTLGRSKCFSLKMIRLFSGTRHRKGLGLLKAGEGVVVWNIGN